MDADAAVAGSDGASSPADRVALTRFQCPPPPSRRSRISRCAATGTPKRSKTGDNYLDHSLNVVQDAELGQVRGQDPGRLEQVDPRPVRLHPPLDRSQSDAVVGGALREQSKLLGERLVTVKGVQDDLQGIDVRQARTALPVLGEDPPDLSGVIPNRFETAVSPRPRSRALTICELRAARSAVVMTLMVSRRPAPSLGTRNVLGPRFLESPASVGAVHQESGEGPAH